ncbi:chorismate--pyruvate lyase family protein [Bowmanella denitrificans]|uniref:chorismate--pyruvate lyase family protein n=1 Tax=Bowmanella denitrificans TaxID=366582 RepID=UPI0031DB5143
MNLSLDFPFSPAVTWHSPEFIGIPDFHLKNWLLDTSSLTERLQSHCRHFRVQLLGQQLLPLLDNEKAPMQNQPCQVREVLLWGEEHPWVFARSLLPESLVQEGMRELAALGEQSLGKVLFNNSDCLREPFELTRLGTEHELMTRLGLRCSHDLWGRRSRFSYKHWHMMVAEIFLPGCPAYKQFGATYV